MKNKNKKYIFFLDRFPYIIFLLVIIFSILLFFFVDSRIELSFFSSGEPAENNTESYNIFISSPADGDIFDFINQNETVPIEIKAKDIEDKDFKINILINDQTIKTFTSPPYEFNWNPKTEGEYQLVIQVTDQQNNTIALSNQITFLVQYQQMEKDEKILDEDIEQKKTRILTEKQYRPQNDVNGRPIFSFKAYTPPVIDGSINEWDDYEKFTNFVPTIKKENYTSHTDISGTFYSCWDNENFYFAIEVVDDVFNQNYSGSQLTNGDSVVMVIDSDLEGDFNIQTLSNDDYQIDISPGNFSDLRPEAFMKWPNNAPLQNIELHSVRLSNGYIIEGSIPWNNFSGYEPQDEDIIGFTVSILDTDNLQSTELVISSSKQFDFNNIFTLGNIVLIDVGDFSEPETEI